MPTPAPRTPKRQLIAVGIADPGDKTRWPRLPSVRTDLERMRKLFVGDLGYEDVALTEPRDTGATAAVRNLDLSAEEIRNGLLEFRAQNDADACDALVFYFSGHALPLGNDLRLCTRGFTDSLVASGLDVRSIADTLDRAASKIWIILDVCSAASGAEALLHGAAQAMKREGGGLWFLASSGGRAPSYEGVFSSAFVAAARACPRPYDAFVVALQDELDRGAMRQRALPFSVGNVAFDLLGDEPSVPRDPAGKHAPAGRAPRGLLAGCALLVAMLAGWLLASDGSSGTAREHVETARTPAAHDTPAKPSSAASASAVVAPTLPPTAPAPTQAAHAAKPSSAASAAAVVAPTLPPTAPAPAPASPPAGLDTPPVGGLSVAVLVMRAGHLVRVDTRQPLQNGERFGIFVTSAEPAYAGVLHVGAHGAVTNLYPAKHDLLLEAGVPTRVPPLREGDFEADDETGVERFVVFASPQPIAPLATSELVRQIRAAVPWPASWSAAVENEHATRRRAVVVRGTFLRPRDERSDQATIIAAVLIEVGHVARN